MPKSKIWIASFNKNKVKEFKDILGDNINSNFDLNHYVQPEENGLTYEENAKIKSNDLFLKTGGIVISDDSGFEIEDFDNGPGIKSARWLKELSYEQKCEYIAKNFVGSICRYVCVISITSNVETKIFKSKVEGIVASKPIGNNGFGYDPIFLIEKENKTVAQLGSFWKSRNSHRAKALAKTLKYIRGLQND